MDEKKTEETTLEEKIDKAIGILLDGIRTNLKPPEALQQTQAVLNMAHAKQLLILTERKSETKKQGVGA